MPYVKESVRKQIEPCSGRRYAETPGELNYQLTRLCFLYEQSHGYSYQTYNDIIGALEGAKLEMYRRRVAAYEDTKLNENGDVYE